MVHGLNVAISGQTYIEPGVPYSVSCTVDEYRDNRQTTFSTTQSPETVIVWYYKQYGCFHWSNGNATDCMNAACSCDDNGLTTHWKYKTPLNLSPPVIFRCFTTDNNSAITNSDPFEANIPHGPGSSLNFDSSSEFFTKVLGQEFSVTCFADCKPQCQFYWTKLTSVVSSGAVLHIPTLSKDDNGTYVCNASNGYGIDGTKSMYLTVNYSPENITLSPTKTKYTVTEGKSLKPINCTANCRPLCNYTWSGPNVPAGTTQSLSLQNINRNQMGFFYCIASNNEGILQSPDVNINVEFGPGSSVQFNPGNTSVSYIKGGTLGPINCSAKCNPPCEYTWTRPDKTTINAAQLIVPQLSAEGQGHYICTASNVGGDSRNKTLNVIVNYGPESVTLVPTVTQYTETEGTTLLPINCSADCRPACNYTWFGPNVPKGSTNILHLQKIQKNQSGIFNCTGYNDFGRMQSSNIKLNVQFGPGSSIRFDPVNSTVTKKKGDTLGPIVCTAVCNPPCQYKWTKPDKSIIDDDKLIVRSLSIVDHGSFICTATNGIDKSQNKSVNVTINYGPSAVILLPSTLQYNVTHGQNVSSINCSSNCRPECETTWTGPNVPSDTSNVLSLQNIKKNQSGDFQCMVANEVGSLQSAIINVNVQYEPLVHKMSINGTNFTVRENTTVILSCNFEGNPSPKNTWQKNSILLGEAEENNKRSHYTIERSRCKDGGNYSCVANNFLGISSAEQTLFVTCSPRLNFEVDQPLPKIGLPKGADLVLTVHLISYPPPQSTVWFFKDKSGNETSISTYLNTYDTFQHVTVLRKVNLTEYDFGDYILKVQNSLGARVQTYHVVPQGPPDPTTIINVTCNVGKAVLYWMTSFNGGETQFFSIIVHNNENKSYMYDTMIDDNDGEKVKFVSIKLAVGDYIFKIFGKNNYGNQNSTNSIRCQVKDDFQRDSKVSVGAAVGGGTGAAIFVLLIIVTIVFIKKRRSFKGVDGRRHLTTKDQDDDEELQDNPLYVSSEAASNDSGPSYSIVNKTINSDITAKSGSFDQGPIYSQVQKTNTKGKITSNRKHIKKTGKPGNAEKEMEMGCVYENSKNMRKNTENDETYAANNATKENIYRPTKNKDGLIYADLDLTPCVGGPKFVIRGLENRSNYAIIDLTKTAEPLPPDEDEDEDGEHPCGNIQEKSEDK